MGCCASTSSDGTNEATKDEQGQQPDVKKLLFLGPGGCGKSTLFKQLRQIFGASFDEDERRAFAVYIVAFVIETVAVVLVRIENKDQLSKEGQAAATYMSTLDTKLPFTPETTAHIKTLWSEPFFKQCFEEEVTYTIFQLKIIIFFLFCLCLLCMSIKATITKLFFFFGFEKF
ncbi:guanine nucleotide-binding protein subunit alpha-11 [Reticulomyxa filosa]|uniref:Guanine nucleotide-binding protein subunit alpha-11 n=1 Tax=Reticulomyxa filosa TaxID=46433 RepID=X6MW81_RETFI|nr:guanine nucleotide-binding protein subunit alpha-11 [Reticulomyxa filosa]|eukprot:ETO18094.1 guanine nucleotide-binding protein subunit alpha-11 [Reticulomyxa filosa]